MPNARFIKEFPFLCANPDLVFLDNAATTHKPKGVLDALTECYQNFYFPVQRGRYTGSTHASELYERARVTVAHFISAAPDACCFVPGATIASNWVAQSLAARIDKRAQVILSFDAHHSCIAPWIMEAKNKNCVLKFISPSNDGEYDYSALEFLLQYRTSCIVIPLVSHSFGYHVNLKRIIEHVKVCAPHVYIIVDATQAASTIPIDVSKTPVDALFWSGHKCYAPSGTGVLYLSERLRSTLEPPVAGGGSLVTIDERICSFLSFPQSWEAGSINLPGCYGLMRALEWMHHNQIHTYVAEHYRKLKKRLVDFLQTTRCVIVSGASSTSIISFYHPDLHAHDIADACNAHNICVRSGFLCADLPHTQLELPALVRVSFAVYTSEQDIEKLIQVLDRLKL